MTFFPNSFFLLVFRNTSFYFLINLNCIKFYTHVLILLSPPPPTNRCLHMSSGGAAVWRVEAGPRLVKIVCLMLGSRLCLVAHKSLSACWSFPAPSLCCWLHVSNGRWSQWRSMVLGWGEFVIYRWTDFFSFARPRHFPSS